MSQNLKIKLEAFKSKFKPLSLSIFNLLTACWLAIGLNIGFYERILELTPYNGIKSELFLASSICIVIALYTLIMQILGWKWTAKAVAILLVIVGGFSSYFVNSLGVIITPDQIQNMMQTDFRETRDLVSVKLFVWTAIFVILPLLLIVFVKIKNEAISQLILKKIAYSIASVAVVCTLLFAFYVDYAAIFREHRDLKGMISPQNAITSTTSYYRKKAPKKNLPLVIYGEDAHLVEKIGTQKSPKLMVLVVGETARAESFSLNGYARNTNPELSKLDVINFKKVSSCGTATAVSVPCMFSGMMRKTYDEGLASHREGLLDVAQRAGYKVTWIDNNSGCKGTCNRVEKYVIPKEIEKKWCDKDGECLDGILVDSLKNYIANIPKEDNSPRLVVLHQMGSHGPAYYKRTTQELRKFKPTCDTTAIQGCSQEVLKNTYDNTIVYTDFVLSQMIQTLKDTKNFDTAFWYLSDHGESTGEKGLYLHGAPYGMAPSQQTHIPMVLWFSQAWQDNHPDMNSCLQAQTDKPLSQDNLFPTLLSLLGVRTQVIDPENDMLSQCSSTHRA